MLLSQDYWVNPKSASGPIHYTQVLLVVTSLQAGGPAVPIPISNYPPGTIVKVVTTVGNYASWFPPIIAIISLLILASLNEVESFKAFSEDLLLLNKDSKHQYNCKIKARLRWKLA